MELLTAPFEPARRAPPTAIWRPLVGVSLAMLAAVGMGRVLAGPGGLAGEIGLAVQGTALHGGFIAQGLVLALDGHGAWRPAVLRVTGTLLAGFLLSRLSPWGGLALLAVPVVLRRECRGFPVLARIGALGPTRRRHVVIGLAAGVFLGAHLLVTSSRTFGYSVSVPSLAGYATALAYDVGANALSAEWLFRGALFSHWWRRGGFWGAAGTATALSLTRYLLDPALPPTAEARAGALFYLAALSLVGALLRAWSGSLVPGYLAAIAFFAAYRTLVVG
ncbi:MAG TPA: hypothetical protein VJU81_20995 [Methylomirabilota bacterium]|nr:hypothetical protein [Methylomirabilota bacterium]